MRREITTTSRMDSAIRTRFRVISGFFAQRQPTASLNPSRYLVPEWRECASTARLSRNVGYHSPPAHTRSASLTTTSPCENYTCPPPEKQLTRALQHPAIMEAHHLHRPDTRPLSADPLGSPARSLYRWIHFHPGACPIRPFFFSPQISYC